MGKNWWEDQTPAQQVAGKTRNWWEDQQPAQPVATPSGGMTERSTALGITKPGAQAGVVRKPSPPPMLARPQAPMPAPAIDPNNGVDPLAPKKGEEWRKVDRSQAKSPPPGTIPMVTYDGAGNEHTVWIPDPAVQMRADANIRAANKDYQDYRNSRGDTINAISDYAVGKIREGTQALGNAGNAALDLVDPKRQASQFVSENITPLAEKAGQGIGSAIAGADPNRQGLSDLAGAVTGGISEWGATTLRDPVQGASQAAYALEPTHWAAEGYNDLRDALGAAFQQDWAEYNAKMAEANPKLLGGVAGMLPGGSLTIDALRSMGKGGGQSLSSQIFKPGPTAVDRAADILIKKMKRKVQGALARRGDSGVYETLSEVAGLSDKSSGANLRGLAMALGAVPGPAQEALIARVAENADQLPKRLNRAATRATGQSADNAVSTLDELDARLKTEAGPAYDAFYNTPVDQQVFASQILPTLTTEAGQGAARSAMRGLQTEEAALKAAYASGKREAGPALERVQASIASLDDFLKDPLRGGNPTSQALDHIKRAFDDQIEAAGQASYTAKNLRSAKNNFSEAVDRATGGTYGNALGTYEGISRLQEAFDFGVNSLNKKTWELEREMSQGLKGRGWSKGEVEAIAMGVARAIEDAIEAGDNAALTRLNKGKALKNIATALQDENAAAMFEESMQRLAANREWGRRVAGGSDTAMRQAAIKDATTLEEDPVTRALDRAKNSTAPPTVTGAIWSAVGKPVVEKTQDAYRRLKYPGIYDEDVNAALAPVMSGKLTDKPLDDLAAMIEQRLAAKGKGRIPPPSGPVPPPVGGPPGRKKLGGPSSPPAPSGPRTPPAKMGFGGPSKLPMDEASRMARAREQGFDVDTPLYHGTANEFDEFSKQLHASSPDAREAFFFTTNPTIASDYAAEAARAKTSRGLANDPEYSALIAKSKKAEARKERAITPWGKKSAESDHFAAMSERQQMRTEKNVGGENVVPVYARLRNPKIVTGLTRHNPETFTKILRDAKAAGHDGVIFKGYDDAIFGKGFGEGDTYAIFDPQNIRSKFASFDPSQSGSSKLLAGMPARTPEAVGVGAGAVLAPDANGDGKVDGIERFGGAVSGLMATTAGRTLIRAPGSLRNKLSRSAGDVDQAGIFGGGKKPPGPPKPPGEGAPEVKDWYKHGGYPPESADMQDLRSLAGGKTNKEKDHLLAAQTPDDYIARYIARSPGADPETGPVATHRQIVKASLAADQYLRSIYVDLRGYPGEKMSAVDFQNKTFAMGASMLRRTGYRVQQTVDEIAKEIKDFDAEFEFLMYDLAGKGDDAAAKWIKAHGSHTRGKEPPRSNGFGGGGPKKPQGTDPSTIPPRVMKDVRALGERLPPDVRSKISANALSDEPVPAMQASEFNPLMFSAAQDARVPMSNANRLLNRPRKGPPRIDPMEAGLRKSLEAVSAKAGVPRVGPEPAWGPGGKRVKGRPVLGSPPEAPMPHSLASTEFRTKRAAETKAQRAYNRAEKAGTLTPDKIADVVKAEREANAARDFLKQANLAAFGQAELRDVVRRELDAIAKAMERNAPNPRSYPTKGQRVSDALDDVVFGAPPKGARPRTKGAPDMRYTHDESQQMAKLLFSREYAKTLDDIMSGKITPENVRQGTKEHLMLAIAGAGGLVGVLAATNAIFRGPDDSKYGAPKPPEDPRVVFNWESEKKNRRLVENMQIRLNQIEPRYQLREDGIWSEEGKTDKAYRFWQYQNRDVIGDYTPGVPTDAELKLLDEQAQEKLRNEPADKRSIPSAPRAKPQLLPAPTR